MLALPSLPMIIYASSISCGRGHKITLLTYCTKFTSIVPERKPHHPVLIQLKDLVVISGCTLICRS